MFGNDDSTAGFNRPWAQVKHVAKSVFNGGLKGALIGAIAVGAMALALGAMPFGLPLLAAGAGSGLLTSALVMGGVLGAKIGGAIGGVKGLFGANEAADIDEERHRETFARSQMREQQRAMLAQRTQMQQAAMSRQAQSMGLSPNVPFGKGPDSPQLG